MTLPSFYTFVLLAIHPDSRVERIARLIIQSGNPNWAAVQLEIMSMYAALNIWPAGTQTDFDMFSPISELPFREANKLPDWSNDNAKVWILERFDGN